MAAGRPRELATDGRILTAAGALLVERGYAGLSIDEVAIRAGIAKTTLYRRWPTKAHLVVAVITVLQGGAPMPDTGDPVQDLVELAAGIAEALRAAGAGLVAGLVVAAAEDPTVREQVDALWRGRREVAAGLLRRAADAGRISETVDHGVRLDLIVGPLYYRLLVTGDPIDPEYARAVARAVLAM